MIDWDKSAELNKMSVEKLRARFEKYPSSEKRIVSVCDECGAEREGYIVSYRDLCGSCAQKKYFKDTPNAASNHSKAMLKYYEDPKHREAAAKRSANYFKNHPEARIALSENVKQQHKDNPELRKKHSEFMTRRFKDNPEIGKAHSIWMKKWFSDPEVRKKMSDIRLNSDAAEAVYEEMRGGNDINKHHFIYDHAHPENHVVEITRTEHSAHHRWMDRNGIEVPHLNATDENINIFRNRGLQ